MAKRYTDSEVWKRQLWFRRLPKDYKFAFFYIKDMCDTIGVWKIDCANLMEDTGIDDFNLEEFITLCNQDYDKKNGSKIVRQRLKMISENELWITGFMQFQYESKDTGKISVTHLIGKSALEKLWLKGMYQEAIKLGYIYVNEPFIYRGKLSAANGSVSLRTAAAGSGLRERERERE